MPANSWMRLASWPKILLRAGGEMNLAELGIILGGATAVGIGGAMIMRRCRGLHVDTATAQTLSVLLVLAWAGLVGTLAVLRHLAFNSSAWDLGIFDQMIWNSAQGRWFENSVIGDTPHGLGNHFSPMLLVLVPVYWLFPSPSTIVVAQALILALAGLPIFWLARDLLKSQGLALSVLLAYLLHPATAYVALFDFHEISLAAPLLALALYLLLRQNHVLFGLALALAFLVKEEIGLTGAAIGLFMALFQRRRFAGLGLAIVGIAWTLFLVRYVIPSFRPDGSYYFATLYTNLGSTPREVLTNLLRDPGGFLTFVLAPNKQLYIQQLFAPLGGLPFLGWPVIIVTLPSFLSIFLSGKMPSDLIQYQYSATILPPLLVASVVGLSWLRERAQNRWPSMAPILAVFLAAAAVLGAYLYGPLPLARRFAPEKYQQVPRLESARQLIAQIPPEASVIAQANLVPQLNHRRVIQLFNRSHPTLHPDYYFLDTDSKALRFPIQQDDDWSYFKSIARITSDAEYRVAAEREGYLLIKRDVLDTRLPVAVTFGDQITLDGYNLVSEQVLAGGNLAVTVYWQAKKRIYGNFSLFVHVLDSNGRLWGQRDGYPASEYMPTSEWQPDRLLRAHWSIPIDPHAPSGEYRVLVGMYDLASMQRLPVSENNGFEQQGDAVVLRVVRVATP